MSYRRCWASDFLLHFFPVGSEKRVEGKTVASCGIQSGRNRIGPIPIHVTCELGISVSSKEKNIAESQNLGEHLEGA